MVVSPLAEGLFQRAILQSGSGMDDAVESLASGEARGVQMAKMMGVDGTDAAAARALRAMPVEKILSTSANYRTRLMAGGEVAPQMWRSVVDGWAIPKPVDVLLKAGDFHRVPILIGTNADEGSPVVARDARVNTLEAYREAVKHWYGDDEGILTRAYPAKDVTGIIPALERLYGDEKYGAPARAFARLASAHRVPVYFYFFTRVAEGAREPGASHGSDSAFFFGRSTLPPALGTTPYDAALAKTMSDYYVAFVTRGDPNGSDRPKWPQYEHGSENYFELGREIVVRQNLRKAEWDAQDQVARRRGAIRP
jgi:para-nitrobenzyl esterase